jgi:hypothetical protein
MRAKNEEPRANETEVTDDETWNALFPIEEPSGFKKAVEKLSLPLMAMSMLVGIGLAAEGGLLSLTMAPAFAAAFGGWEYSRPRRQERNEKKKRRANAKRSDVADALALMRRRSETLGAIADENGNMTVSRGNIEIIVGTKDENVFATAIVRLTNGKAKSLLMIETGEKGDAPQISPTRDGDKLTTPEKNKLGAEIQNAILTILDGGGQASAERLEIREALGEPNSAFADADDERRPRALPDERRAEMEYVALTAFASFIGNAETIAATRPIALDALIKTKTSIERLTRLRGAAGIADPGDFAIIDHLIPKIRKAVAAWRSVASDPSPDEKVETELDRTERSLASMAELLERRVADAQSHSMIETRAELDASNIISLIVDRVPA